MPGKRRFFWHLYPAFLLITGVSLGAITWYASDMVRDFYLEQTAHDLEARARLFEGLIEPCLAPLDQTAVHELAKKSGRRSSTRFTVILPSGRVVGDSHEDPAAMDNHADRPEFVEAVTKNRGHSIRHSITLGKDLMYVAVPVKSSGRVIAVIRTSIPLSSINHALGVIRTRILLGGLAMVLLAAGLSMYVSRRITRPIKEIKRWAEAIAGGDYSPRPSVSASQEIEGLCDSLSLMAKDLRERLNLVVRQRNEIEAVFSSMMEGIIALDMEERVMGMNQAAAGMLGCDPAAAKGKSIQEVARNTGLHRFVREALDSGGQLQRDFAVSFRGQVVLNARGTALRDAQGKQMGALILLSDVTRIRMLENMRRDFVSNVSHEIRTPITAIKGFVETLRDGALKDPEDARRFVEIILRHAERLEAIIEDLLKLARIEGEVEHGEIVRVESPVREILQGAVAACQAQAGDRQITVEVSCASTLTARVDPSLMEQALVNLLDNAIKYGHRGSTVRVEAAQGEGEVTIAVRDEGPGIEKKHLPRLFERFYRIDKSRSRRMGGTGLGLAIVKHIVQAHGGSVTVESALGKGSTFTIHLADS